MVSPCLASESECENLILPLGMSSTFSLRDDNPAFIKAPDTEWVLSQSWLVVAQQAQGERSLFSGTIKMDLTLILHSVAQRSR
ncbi:hypothetical protein [Nostoc sp.]|uniref:hypothetical protein n=1 Tax=Nostoc sp. TaxID=1180 RepID=UPI0035939D85